ncbi:MAG: efflux RND transporter periplasmic adaptor subunit [Myxococcales bacterium]
MIRRDLAGWLRALGLLLVGNLSAACGLWPSQEAPRDDVLVVATGDVVYRTQATGRIVPREEVFVRSLVAGQLIELNVRPGDLVKKGEHLATVRIVADPVTLNEARSRVQVAEMKLTIARREVERVSPLRGGTALSGKDLARAEDDERIARVELESARERFQLVSEGASKGRGSKSTRIVATVTGTVLAIPAAVGDYVSETNSYRDGTTIAVLADMTQLLFKGQIEEAYVGKLKLGMDASVRIGALPGVTFPGRLAWIAPRATIEQATASVVSASPNSVVPLTSSSAGITRFELWIEVQNAPPDVRAGYSAAAELELERKDKVLVVQERALRFDAGKVFAKVRTTDGKAVEREVQVGVSDGLQIEIVSGLEMGDRVAVASGSIP